MRNAAILLAGPLLAFLFVMTDVWASRFGGDGDAAGSSAQFERREAQLRDARELLSQLNAYRAQYGDGPADPRAAWESYLGAWNTDTYAWAVDPADPDLFELTGDVPFADVHGLLSAVDQESGPWIVEELALEAGERGTRFRMLVKVSRAEGVAG